MLPRDIVVAIDFSDGSKHALAYACELAAAIRGATVHLVHAMGASLPEMNLALGEAAIGQLREGSQAALAKLTAEHPGTTFGPPLVIYGDPRDVILEAAASVRAGLIVMGTHGRRGVSRFVIGSVAENVVRRAPCPVLTIRDERT